MRVGLLWATSRNREEVPQIEVLCVRPISEFGPLHPFKISAFEIAVPWHAVWYGMVLVRYG